MTYGRTARKVTCQGILVPIFFLREEKIKFCISANITLAEEIEGVVDGFFNGDNVEHNAATRRTGPRQPGNES